MGFLNPNVVDPENEDVNSKKNVSVKQNTPKSISEKEPIAVTNLEKKELVLKKVYCPHYVSVNGVTQKQDYIYV